MTINKYKLQINYYYLINEIDNVKTLNLEFVTKTDKSEKITFNLKDVRIKSCDFLKYF